MAKPTNDKMAFGGKGKAPPFGKGAPKGKPGKAGVKNVDAAGDKGKGKMPPFMKKGK